MLDWTSKLSARQRTLLSEKLFDAGNLALGALVFGQLLGSRPASLGWILAGCVVWAGLMTFSSWLIRKDLP